ncbi:MAG: hypothetical protein HY671_13320 [Chloroflexi bacterium]|nr:hypothetical protein [Chloroflexota bacterium]
MPAHETADEVPKTWGQMGDEQLKLYARELAQHFNHEKELRRDLSVKNGELEKRVQELTALNAMFQKHLDMRLRTEQAFEQLTEGISRLIDQANALIGRAQSLALGTDEDMKDGP